MYELTNRNMFSSIFSVSCLGLPRNRVSGLNDLIFTQVSWSMYIENGEILLCDICRLWEYLIATSSFMKGNMWIMYTFHYATLPEAKYVEHVELSMNSSLLSSYLSVHIPKIIWRITRHSRVYILSPLKCTGDGFCLESVQVDLGHKSLQSKSTLSHSNCEYEWNTFSWSKIDSISSLAIVSIRLDSLRENSSYASILITIFFLVVFVVAYLTFLIEIE